MKPKQYLRCLLGLAMLLSLSGCGLTGPLYLPDQPPPYQSPHHHEQQAVL